MASVFVYHSLNDLRRPYISRPSFWTILDFSNDVTMSPLQSVYHIQIISYQFSHAKMFLSVISPTRTECKLTWDLSASMSDLTTSSSSLADATRDAESMLSEDGGQGHVCRLRFTGHLASSRRSSQSHFGSVLQSAWPRSMAIR